MHEEEGRVASKADPFGTQSVNRLQDRTLEDGAADDSDVGVVARHLDGGISAWKAAGWSGNSRSCTWGNFSRMIFAFVEPCWADTRLPARSFTDLIGLPCFTRSCAPV